MPRGVLEGLEIKKSKNEYWDDLLFVGDLFYFVVVFYATFLFSNIVAPDHDHKADFRTWYSAIAIVIKMSEGTYYLRNSTKSFDILAQITIAIDFFKSEISTLYRGLG